MMALNERPCPNPPPKLPLSSAAVVEKITMQWHDVPDEVGATAIAYCGIDQ